MSFAVTEHAGVDHPDTISVMLIRSYDDNHDKKRAL